MTKAVSKCAVVVPNWNGKHHLKACLGSLVDQSQAVTIVVVDNGSRDGSAAFISKNFPRIVLHTYPKNIGFTGAVNDGIGWAIENGYEYVALLNNDAVADRDWVKKLVHYMDTHQKTGIATSKIVGFDGKLMDSTGEFYSIWGLSFSRGRDEPVSNLYDKDQRIFGASGGASIYRISMLKQIGLFDNDFFAYYEDVDISFRARLAGWEISYVPTAIVRHHIGATLGKIRGFTTYQTIKNLPMLAFKNVPSPLIWTVWPRLWLAHSSYFWKAVFTGRGAAALKGLVVGAIFLIKKIPARRRIQSTSQEIKTDVTGLIVSDLPPDANNLRRLRGVWWQLIGRRS